MHTQHVLWMEAADAAEMRDLWPRSSVALTQTSRGVLGERVVRASVDGCTILCGVLGAAHTLHAVVPAQAVCFSAPPTVTAESRRNGLPIDSASLAICRPGGEVLSSDAAGQTVRTVFVDLSLVERMRADLNGEPNRVGGEDLRLYRGAREAHERLGSVLSALADAAVRTPEAFESARFRRNAGGSVAMAVGLAEMAAQERAQVLTDLPLAVRRSHVRIIEEYLRDNPNQVVRLPDICRLTGVGARALQVAFREVWGVSPSRYLRLRRFQQVRSALRRREPGSTVTDLALDHGFWDLGRFSVEYRRMFGESPAQTLGRRRPDAQSLRPEGPGPTV